MHRKHILIVSSVAAALAVVAGVVSAGTFIIPPGPPETTSSYRLEDIYNRLSTGADGVQITFTEPISGPTVGTGYTLDEIMAVAPQADDTNGTIASQVVSGMTYWGLQSGTWGLQTGTAIVGSNVTGGDGLLTFSIPDGFYTASKTATAQDDDLAAGNIAQGVDIFGVAGSAALATGDATPADVLTGTTFSGASGAGLSGAMMDNGAVLITPTVTSQTIALGYHDGGGYVKGDADLAAGNIAQGVDIFGVAGSAALATGDATPADVLTGMTFSSASGAGLSGAMADNGAVIIAPTVASQTILLGYHDGGGYVEGDTDLVSGNIHAGVNLFGVDGNSNVVNTVSGDAAEQDILNGMVAWVDGGAVTGTMVNNGAVIITPTIISQMILLGYHDGGGYVEGDADLIAGNIRAGVNLFGVDGNPNVVNTVSGDATAAEILSDTVAWVDGDAVTGTMANNGAVLIAPTVTSQTILLGYHDGSGYVKGDANLVSGTIHAGVNLFGVDGNPNVVNTVSGDAAATDILSGTVAWVDGGAVTGTMANNGAVLITPTVISQAIVLGYHDGSGYVKGDADLVSGTIHAGVNLFGVDGNSNVVNTASGDATAADILSGTVAWVDGVEVTGSRPPAPVPRTGKTISLTVGDDGDLEKGVAWPNPRFITGTTGVVTDALTGLVWLENANCFGTRSWVNAMADANALNSGECGLSDGSVEGDWRLPNVREMLSLIDYGAYRPALPVGHPFDNVAVAWLYWTSTVNHNIPSDVWHVDMVDGYAQIWNNTAGYCVWPVRGGE